MSTPKKILSQVTRETRRLIKQLKRDKSTLISPETLVFALDLSESIKADRITAKKIKGDLKNTTDWPFPKFNSLGQ